MLKIFRGLATSWIGPVIMGALVLAFGILGGGMRNVIVGRIQNAVIQAGSHQVDEQDFAKMFEAKKADYERQTSQPFPLEELVKEGGDKAMVQDLAQQTAFTEMLARLGIRPSDDVIATELRRQAESGNSGLAQVFDPITGKFKPQLLNALLARNGISMKEFQEGLSDDIASAELGSAVQQGFQLPRIYAAVQAALLLESRDITYFVIPAGSVPKPPPPTDAQLNALIQAHRDQLMLPERRVLTIVRFSAKALAPTMPVDPKAVEQQFAAKKADYAKPELRSLIEIPLNDPRQAAAVGAALAKGEDPNAVAKQIGSDAIVYADQPQSAIADVKAAAAAFAMKAGDISGPVQGDFKTVILKVTKITPAQAPDLNAARAKITADLQQQEAIDKVYDVSQKFEDLVQGGSSLTDAAAKVGASAVTVGPVTSEGKQAGNPQPNPELTPKLLKTAFDLAQGADSDVEQDADKGELYAVHVDKVIAPNPPGLDEPGVRPFLVNAYYQEAIVGALQKKAAAAESAIRKGTSFEAVAAASGARVAHQVGLQRVSAQQYQATLGQDVLAATFDAKPGELFTAGSDALKGYLVARLDAVRPADPKQVAMLLDTIRQRSTGGYLDGLAGAMREAAVKWIKPTTDLDLARSAMGIDPAMVARANPKPKAAGLAR